nr:Peptidase C48, SUMO/Sentrin/Ubl1 [Ipomoea batatas]
MAFASSTIRSKRSATGPPSEQLALLRGGRGEARTLVFDGQRGSCLATTPISWSVILVERRWLSMRVRCRIGWLPVGLLQNQPVGSTDGTSSDDDFQTAPRGFVEADRRGTGVDVGMAKDGRAPVGVFKEFLTIKTRCRPKRLVCAIKDFNSRQCEAVREIGFGGVLELQVTDAPLRLGYWLVTNFHPEDMSVHLPNGMKLLLTKDDVAATLGLPSGPITITERDSPVVGPYLRQ